MSKKILIAEDDGFISEMYSTKLVMEGFDVSIALDGQEALDLLKESKPDLVLLDVIMPKKSGLEVLEKLKADSQWKRLPVIILTNAGEKEIVDKAMRLGADDYLIKSSYTPEEVVAKIKQLFKKKNIK